MFLLFFFFFFGLEFLKKTFAMTECLWEKKVVPVPARTEGDLSSYHGSEGFCVFSLPYISVHPYLGPLLPQGGHM